MMFYDVYPRKSYADFIKPSFETLKRIGYYSRNPENVIVANKAFNGTHGKEFPLGLRRYSDRRYHYDGNGGVVTIKYQNTVMGYVHPDDTFEFTNTRHWASYNCKQDILNRLFNAFGLVRLSREGGMVLIDCRTGKFNRNTQYVVFDGLRVNINTLELHPSSNHHIEVTYLDRKLTKAVRNKREDEFKAARAFIMAANVETLRQDSRNIKSVYERDLYEHFVVHIWRELSIRSFRNSGVSYLNEVLEENKTNWFDKAKKKILEDMYLKEQPFKTRILQAGERIPTGNWGFKIIKHTGA
jgi:hypothetical protein